MSAPSLMPFQDLPFNGDNIICEKFLELKTQFNINVTIETGSCFYSTTQWLAQHFEKVFTVEINPNYAKHGVHKIEALDNTHHTIGVDSVKWLMNDMPIQLKKTDKCLFFLDAHWEQNCPLISEIVAISLLDLDEMPIIAIHDFYTGDETLGYDTYNGQRFDSTFIVDAVNKIQDKYNTKYDYVYNTQANGAKRGIVYLIPQSASSIQSTQSNQNDNWVKNLHTLTTWRKYSQTNEECYIAEILKNIPSCGKHIVELGAWDGYHLSNTRYFIENLEYTALLIDGDNKGNTEVKEHFITKENILPILKSYKTPIKFDFLCIDLDGNDLYVLEEILKQYEPSLIVAEFNPIWQPHESKVITYDEKHTWNNDNYYGFSFMAGCLLAKKYGYRCIFQNDSLNMYLVKEEYVKDIPNTEVQYAVAHYHPASHKTTWVDYTIK
jgi:hypothetical protein